MPKFDFNPADAVSGIPVYPKDSYEVELGEPVSFYRAGKDGKADNYGVMFKSKIRDGKFAGKPTIINCYMHNEDSLGFTKSVQMAALGYTPRKSGEDERFNADHGTDGWGINTDDRTCDQGWHNMKGQTLVWDADTKIDKNGEQQQVTLGYRPLGS